MLSVGGWWFFGREQKVEYETEVSKRGDIVEIVSVSGTLEPQDSVEVAPETSGMIRTIFVEKGERVEKGDVLAKIDDAVLQSQKREAQLAVETAVQQEWLARRYWDDLEKEERAIKKLASESARASLATIEQSIAKTVLRAPISGVVTKQYLEMGEIANSATPIMQITAPDSRAYVEADVPESDIARLEIGQIANVTLDALTQEDVFRATVEFIDPRATVIQDVVYYRTKFVLDETDARFKPGMSADADVETDRSENAVLVPRRAVKEDDAGTYVETLLGEGVSRRDVQTGIEDDEGSVEIVQGISDGEVLIVGTE